MDLSEIGRYRQCSLAGLVNSDRSLVTILDDGIISDYNAQRRYNDSMRVLTILWCSCVRSCGVRAFGIAASAPVLYVFSLDRSAFIELSTDLQSVREVPF